MESDVKNCVLFLLYVLYILKYEHGSYIKITKSMLICIDPYFNLVLLFITIMLL
jgi:hypothetical protein